jgi:ABC-type branched-subunit amino acid transport system ATPase component
VAAACHARPSLFGIITASARARAAEAAIEARAAGALEMVGLSRRADDRAAALP